MTRTVRELKFAKISLYHDIFEFDMEEPLAGFFEATEEIWWGLLVATARGAVSEHAHIPGQDWQIRFWPPNDFEIPSPSVKTRRTYSRRVRHACALLGVRLGAIGLNQARDVGRPAARALLGLARREFAVLRPNQVLWEGPYTYLPEGKLKMATGLIDIEAMHPVPAQRFSHAGLRLAEISISKLPTHLFRALSWLALARSAQVKQEKFVHLWLAIRALVDFSQPNKGHQMTRVERYTASMGYGLGGVISSARIAQLNDRIRVAYNLRTALLHYDDDTKITTDSLDDIEEVVFQLVDFELAKLGHKIHP